MNYVRFITSLVKITSLHIEFQYFSIAILIEFLRQLPNLDSITISCKFLNQRTKLSEELMNPIYAMENRNQIINISIEQMIELNQIEIILNICTHLEYLQVQCTNYTDLESIVRLVLKKRYPKLNCLCCTISMADDLMVKKLQTAIYYQNMTVNFNIHRCSNKIYLKW